MALGEGAADELAGRNFSSILASLEVAPDTRAGDRPSYDLTTELTGIFAEFGVNLVQKPLPPDLVAWVDEALHLYTNDWRDYTEESLERAKSTLPLVYRELEKHNLPSSLAAVPFIQTGYRDDIVMKSGAAGLWRFMPQTARDYGLVVEPPERDDRLDPYLHTVAACQHFDYLLKLFGSSAPLCALTAYSSGAGGMSRCLAAESDWRSPWRYWDLIEKEVDCLTQESAEFVPRFLAVAVVMRRPDAFGLAE
jgi:membrane-bound lytic murein transglycosylase D